MCQPMEHVYSCLELTDVKVYRPFNLQECLNIRRYSVDVEPTLKWDPKSWKATVSFIVSIHLSEGFGNIKRLISLWTHVHEIWWLLLSENVSTKGKSQINPGKSMGSLHEDLCTLLLISSWICNSSNETSFREIFWENENKSDITKPFQHSFNL